MERTHQKVELPAASEFLWKVNNFSEWSSQLFYSAAFNAGGVRWRVQMHPLRLSGYLSVYLIPVELTNLPVDAEFSFAITSRTVPSNTVRWEGKKKFVPGIGGWGFEKFMPLSQLHDPKNGYILDNSFEIKVEVTCEATAKSTTDDIIKEKSPGNNKGVPELELNEKKIKAEKGPRRRRRKSSATSPTCDAA